MVTKADIEKLKKVSERVPFTDGGKSLAKVLETMERGAAKKW